MDATTTETTTTDRPASMTAALETVEASSASTPVETTPSEQPADATAPPEGTESEQATVETKTGAEPNLPLNRHKAILENARKTIAEETEARVRQEIEQKYTGLQDFTGIHPNDRMGLLVWHRALAGDPAAIAQITTATRQNPALAATLQGMLAREAEKPAAQESEPGPDLQGTDGTLAYSENQARLRDEYRERKLLTKFEARFKPLEDARAAGEAAERKAEYQATTAGVVASMASADPDFNANKVKVWEALSADQDLMTMALGDGDIKPNPKLALEIAWHRVYRSTVLPAKQQTTQTQSEAQVLTSLQRTAVAGTMNPAAAQTGSKKRPASMADALADQRA